ncbi:FxSxx-COOH cyclophane-containing RiPP peptide [Streptomyces sp. NPDC091299]|uniref:FxSxx-COOH cyclophane-containing RiPP peptide n=1 Tax=Streptomyces sp. NPDC091299 TaxID=3155302 RepID=UPI003422714B
MEARYEAAAEVAEAGEPTAQAPKPLPDLLELDLDELRTLRHPVLTEVLDELRERAAQPSEMLWGFNSAF